MATEDRKIAKIQTHFKALAATASSLNAASDELSKAIGVLDEALKKLNVGVSVWVAFQIRDVEPPLYDQDEIGYAKVGGTWGLSLRRIWGDESRDERDLNGPWLFNDAPRAMRLNSVDKITDVIEALAKKASDTAKKVQEKTKQVREIASAIGGMSDESQALNLITGFREMQARIEQGDK